MSFILFFAIHALSQNRRYTLQNLRANDQARHNVMKQVEYLQAWLIEQQALENGLKCTTTTTYMFFDATFELKTELLFCNVLYETIFSKLKQLYVLFKKSISTFWI